jgi:hypothetical protein
VGRTACAARMHDTQRRRGRQWSRSGGTWVWCVLATYTKRPSDQRVEGCHDTAIDGSGDRPGRLQLLHGLARWPRRARDAMTARADGAGFTGACKRNGRDGWSRGRMALSDGDETTDSQCAIEQRQ